MCQTGACVMKGDDCLVLFMDVLFVSVGCCFSNEKRGRSGGERG